MSHRRLIILISVIFILGTSVRLYHIGAKSLWCDEVGSLLTVKSDLKYVIKNTIEVDAHPPLFYFGLWLWTKLGGTSETNVRSFSAAASSLTVLLFYFLGLYLKDKKFGMVLAALSSVSAYQIYYAQEARLYALVTLIFTANLIVAVRLFERRKVPDAYLLALINVLGCYSYLYYLFVVAIQGLYALTRIFEKNSGGKIAKHFMISQILMLAAFYPWVPVIVRKMSQVGVMPEQSGTLWGWAIPNAFLEYFGGLWHPETEWQYFIVLLSIAGTFVYVLKSQLQDSKARLIFFMLFGLWILLAAMPVKVHVFESKHLIFASPLLLICVGYALCGNVRKIWKLYLLVLYLGVNLCSLKIYFDPLFEKENWREVVRVVESQASTDECVLFNPGFAGYAFDRYSAGKLYRFGLTPESVANELPMIQKKYRTGWLLEYQSRILAPFGAVSKFITNNSEISFIKTLNGYAGKIRIFKLDFKGDAVLNASEEQSPI